jgi:hypothetical protein
MTTTYLHLEQDRPILYGKTWVFFIDRTKPDPNNVKGQPRAYRVSAVIKDEPGHIPTGDPSKNQTPWYWTEEICEQMNAERGFDKLAAWKIVMSSMNAR